MILTKADRKRVSEGLDAGKPYGPGMITALLSTLDAWQENAERLAAMLSTLHRNMGVCRKGGCAYQEALAAHRKLKGEG